MNSESLCRSARAMQRDSDSARREKAVITETIPYIRGGAPELRVFYLRRARMDSYSEVFRMCSAREGSRESIFFWVCSIRAGVRGWVRKSCETLPGFDFSTDATRSNISTLAVGS